MISEFIKKEDVYRAGALTFCILSPILQTHLCLQNFCNSDQKLQTVVNQHNQLNKVVVYALVWKRFFQQNRAQKLEPKAIHISCNLHSFIREIGDSRSVCTRDCSSCCCCCNSYCFPHRQVNFIRLLVVG